MIYLNQIFHQNFSNFGKHYNLNFFGFLQIGKYLLIIYINSVLKQDTVNFKRYDSFCKKHFNLKKSRALHYLDDSMCKHDIKIYYTYYKMNNHLLFHFVS